MELFTGRLEFDKCYALNDVPPQQLEIADEQVHTMMADPTLSPLEQNLRVIIAHNYRQNPAVQATGAKLSPFVYATSQSVTDLNQAVADIVQHKPLALEDSTLKHILETPYQFPVGFFVCSAELVPYCVSACQLGTCLHLPTAVAQSLASSQAKKCLTERGRLLVDQHGLAVWRPLCADQELDTTTRSWITDHPDCLVVTHITSQAVSFLIAEPFLHTQSL